ncbi:acyltransferase [Mycoavidus sp. B2-EB]|uniref:acyltransferase family protein n=1 Tax=Mycoavidus sp. B2-EB TaxID=2651972 RepID=UPI0016252CB7|nr:acyltransferase [Mycoavidus sp. B2-EB]BBO60091.1 acyltransferase [Mycoavidus sp. B2-EB]
MQKNFINNNFDFLRLVAAYLVLFSHQFALTGRLEPNIGVQSLGGLGVLIFFSISGYLVAQSWERDPSAWRFLAKRVLRIWPGLIVVTVVTALLLGPSVSTLSFRGYFLSSAMWDFFSNLKLTVRFELPGVFTDNPYPRAVNGSLWTLPIEFRWYLILLVLGMVGLLRHQSLLLIGAVALAVFIFVIHDVQHNPQRKPSLELGAFFCYGVCLHYFRDFWSMWPKLVLAIFGLVGAIFVAIGYEYAALFLVLPMLVIFFGSASTPFIRRAGRFGDISYGLYIYAFPVQQTVIMLTGNLLSIWVTLVISTIVTVGLAFLSWHLAERPALLLKRKLGKEWPPFILKRKISQPDVDSF